ncbi:MAG TPA: MFS transporter [Solirubrobacterales bacterium]|jgi:MFS family permease|nr:MFS transporter [Solirubrobacterales bacterium]
MRWFSKIAVDVQPLRGSRDFRLITAGSLITGLGTQATLVALPFQVFVITGSAFLTGLIGAAELGPLVVASLFGGALADRHDRRRLLLLCQFSLVAIAAALAVAAATGPPPVWILFVLAAAMAGASAIERVVRAAIVPKTVPPEELPAAISLTYGLYQLTMVAGPGLGGLLISIFGITTPYTVDAVSCLGMAWAAAAMSPQPPLAVAAHEPVLRSIRSGLAYLRRLPAVTAGFVMDLCAMTFGMPRALFPVLALTVYHAGAAGTGLLYAAVAAGSTVAALTTGWMSHARYLGRIVLVCVALWGIFIAGAGLVDNIWPAAVLFALAGAADSVSAVCRNTMMQVLTPERMRGRISSVFSLVVAGGPRLGDVESGTVAAITSPGFSVVSGGLVCLASVGVVAIAFPQLAAYDAAKVGRSGPVAQSLEDEALEASELI